MTEERDPQEQAEREAQARRIEAEGRAGGDDPTTKREERELDRMTQVAPEAHGEA